MQTDPTQLQGAVWPYGAPPPQKKRRWWIWLVAAGGVVVVSCAGCLGALTWLAATGPSTAVYTGNQVPDRFVRIIEDVGAIEPGEKILFLYSDGLFGIEEGFYLVSERKVATYSDNHRPPLTLIPFSEITKATLFRDESFFVDSEIYLALDDGSPFSFPVSSEAAGDVRFFDAIESRLETDETEPN